MLSSNTLGAIADPTALIIPSSAHSQFQNIRNIPNA
jgi:hypothetical protein